MGGTYAVEQSTYIEKGNLMKWSLVDHLTGDRVGIIKTYT